jgi:hypothetical protein
MPLVRVIYLNQAVRDDVCMRNACVWSVCVCVCDCIPFPAHNNICSLPSSCAPMGLRLYDKLSLSNSPPFSACAKNLPKRSLWLTISDY